MKPLTQPLINSYNPLIMSADFLFKLNELGYSEEAMLTSIDNGFGKYISGSHKTTNSIGIIGFGGMGELYTRKLAANKWNVSICDTPQNYQKNKEYIEASNDKEYINLYKTAQEVIVHSDYILFCTEAHVMTTILENIEDKSIFQNKIIGGQASSKSKEVLGLLEFKHKHKLDDLSIICLHNMHGPNVPSKGQNLAIIPVFLKNLRDMQLIQDLVSVFESREFTMTFLQHDKTSANTQGLTHCVFINMGRAWYKTGTYPWLYDSNNTNPLEVVKVNLTFRIFGNNSHIYSNLAIMNPFSKEYIKVFSKNVKEIHDKIQSQEVGDSLFLDLLKMFNKVIDKTHENFEILIMDKTPVPDDNDENTHLSLLALLKTWYDCGIDPLKDMYLCTPLYKLLLQALVKLFANEELVKVATKSIKYTVDDTMYVSSVLEYAQNITDEDRAKFDHDFVEVVDFFKGDDMEQVKQKAQNMILNLK